MFDAVAVEDRHPGLAGTPISRLVVDEHDVLVFGDGDGVPRATGRGERRRGKQPRGADDSADNQCTCDRLQPISLTPLIGSSLADAERVLAPRACS